VCTWLYFCRTILYSEPQFYVTLSGTKQKKKKYKAKTITYCKTIHTPHTLTRVWDVTNSHSSLIMRILTSFQDPWTERGRGAVRVSRITMRVRATPGGRRRPPRRHPSPMCSCRFALWLSVTAARSLYNINCPVDSRARLSGQGPAVPPHHIICARVQVPSPRVESTEVRSCFAPSNDEGITDELSARIYLRTLLYRIIEPYFRWHVDIFFFYVLCFVPGLKLEG
jgi:hypothetical protein